jgi:catechol 2,3-dioxygenase-like lactoylglutathione lyase family enzyme
MTTPLQGLRTVIYPVADLEAAKAWWTDLLGTGPYIDEPFYVGYEVAGYELGLLPNGNPADGALVYWGVPDVSAAVAAAVASGATEHVAESNVGDDIVTATVRNPQGAIVGFIYNPHFRAT